jgi:hypothetical protein
MIDSASAVSPLTEKVSTIADMQGTAREFAKAEPDQSPRPARRLNKNRKQTKPKMKSNYESERLHYRKGGTN